jgi:CubicO group peptidase (beta-lactamase class C family)
VPVIVAVASLLAGAGSTGYPHADEPIGTVRQVYDGTLFPGLRTNTFRNIDQLFPVRTVARGDHVYPIPESESPLEAFEFESDGKRYDLYDYVTLNDVTGLLIVKDGESLFELYESGNTDRTRWMSMSVVKSISATLVGAAIRDGHIESLDDPVVGYLPQLAGSAYDGVTVRHLLQMSSGVAWNETYTDRGSDRRAMLEAQISQAPGAILELMASLPRAAPPGTLWNYSTGETHIVGALLRAATGEHVADYLSEKIWARLGMESDATWWLESPGGLEVGGSGLSATLRDYARFGLFLLADGVVEGERVLPEGFLAEATQRQRIGGELVEYGYMFWPVPNADGTYRDGAYAAIGIFGQYVYVNPVKSLVVAIWGAQSKPVDTWVVDDYDFFAALSERVD